jgi:hypothetical protein
MKKRTCFAVLLAGAAMAIMAVIVFLCLPKHVIFTTDVSNYDTEEYPIGDTLFPEAIPSHAKVVEFSYYDYWHEDTDIYLELKFDSRQALDAFCQDRIRQEEEAYRDLPGVEMDSSPIAKQQNPYDTSFTDLFSLIGFIAEGGKRYVGYEMQNGESAVYNCHYSLISYSYDRMTVILSSCSGRFVADENEYTPRYFRRFDIANAAEKERWIFLPVLDSKNPA